MYVVVIVVGTRCWHRHWLLIAAVICSRLQQYLSGKISVGHLPEFAGHWGCLLVGDRCSFAGTVASVVGLSALAVGRRLYAFRVFTCRHLLLAFALDFSLSACLQSEAMCQSQKKKEPTNVE